MARRLFRDGPRGLGEMWRPFLDAFDRLARPGRTGHPEEGVEAFFAVVYAAQRNAEPRIRPILPAIGGSIRSSRR